MSKTKTDRNKYIASDKFGKDLFELSFDIPDRVDYNSYGLSWRIPEFTYNEKTVPGWKQMSRSERIIYRLIKDPFLWHHYILGYSSYAHQGEWLHEFTNSKNIQLLVTWTAARVYIRR